jgi:aspartate/methionine/tyrosine aminotransferase
MITLNANFTSTKEEQALTEIEALGLASQHDLANGHASQELAPSQQRIIASLPELWATAAKQKSKDAELMFKTAFLKLANAPALIAHDHFKICPTASNSIDTVATWLAEKQLKTALVEPTFDNLYLILKRRNVELSSLPEELLHIETQKSLLDFSPSNSPSKEQYKESYKALFAPLDAIFLVNPNNPTGKVLTQTQFKAIVETCAEEGKVLILDNTFRFFVPQVYDSYKILLESGVTFLSIEDTGKVWPTQEIKASLLFTSANIIKEIHIIYDEIFLCHSNFALGILSAFLTDAFERGLDQAVWKGVSARRKIFRDMLAGSALTIHPDSIDSMISVEWVMIKDHFKNDLDLIQHFQDKNLVLLPGRQFFWSKKGTASTTNFARFALLKPEAEFMSAINVLAKELGSLN